MYYVGKDAIIHEHFLSDLKPIQDFFFFLQKGREGRPPLPLPLPRDCYP